MTSDDARTRNTNTLGTWIQTQETRVNVDMSHQPPGGTRSYQSPPHHGPVRTPPQIRQNGRRKNNVAQGYFSLPGK